MIRRSRPFSFRWRWLPASLVVCREGGRCWGEMTVTDRGRKVRVYRVENRRNVHDKTDADAAGYLFRYARDHPHRPVEIDQDENLAG